MHNINYLTHNILENVSSKLIVNHFIYLECLIKETSVA